MLPEGQVSLCGGAAAQELGGSLSLAMPYLTDNPDTAFVVRERVRNGELMQLKALIKEGVDFKTCFLAPAPTVRGYTPLHIAAWGTAKPNYDRDIVEVILQAAKKAGSEAESAVRAAKDLVDERRSTPRAQVVFDSVRGGPHRPGRSGPGANDSRVHVVYRNSQVYTPSSALRKCKMLLRAGLLSS